MFLMPRDLFARTRVRARKVATAGAGETIAEMNPDRIVLIIALNTGVADMQVCTTGFDLTTTAGILLSLTGASDRLELYHPLAGPLVGQQWVQQSAAASAATVFEVLLERDPRD